MKTGQKMIHNFKAKLAVLSTALVAGAASAQSADPGAAITSGLQSAAGTVGSILLIFAGVWVLYTLYGLITKRKSA
jgi:F0F1-type ATP synthase membrane subunit c/vacuolar-type H+-ATPase subunit K